MAEIRTIARNGALPEGTVTGYCTDCTAEVVVDERELTCPDCGKAVHPDSLPRQQRLRALGQDVPVARPSPPRQELARTPAKTVTLRSTRAALVWDQATDALLAEVEREEQEAEAALAGARERYERARREANYLRQLRGLIRIGDGQAALPAARATTEGKPWSKQFTACRLCNTTERKHAAGGRCTRCSAHYQKYRSEWPEKGAPA